MDWWIGVTQEPPKKNFENFEHKIIWMYWEQGGLPTRSVNEKKCVEEWKRLNPEYNVILLDYEQACKLVPDFHEIKHTVQIRSDYLRVQLLLKYGGVWADVTTYPTRPLKTWLYDEFEKNDGLIFYSFKSVVEYNPEHRKVASWFMAAREKENPIMGKIVNKFKAKILKTSISLPYFVLHEEISKLIDEDHQVYDWWSNITLDAFAAFNKSPKSTHIDNLPKTQHMWKKPWGG